MRTKLVALAAIVAATALVLAEPPPGVHGVVFDDLNANGVREAGEPGLPDVVVSDQDEVVRTGRDGRYTLDAAGGYGLVSVSVPADRRVVGRWWQPVGDGQAPIDFALAAAPASDTFTFIHASDPHLGPDVVGRLARVGEIARARKAAFVIISGDLVRDAMGATEADASALFQLYLKTIATFPVPVRSALGNHDLFGIDRDASGVGPDHPLYGKWMYRHFLGPDYYSFDFGKLHFVGLDAVDIVDRSYYGHVGAGQLAWLERDLATVAPGTPVVTFGHIPLLTGALSAWGYREGMGQGDTLVVVNGKTVFRHVVDDTPDVMTRMALVDWPLALGGHTHAREVLTFVSAGQPTRFEQAASIVEPFPNDPIPMRSGVTLYSVRGRVIEQGEFIPLDGKSGRLTTFARGYGGPPKLQRRRKPAPTGDEL